MRLATAVFAVAGGWMLTTSYEKNTRGWNVGIMLFAYAGSMAAGELIPW